MEYRWLYMTAKDREEATKIARALLELRQVACVNLLGPIQSLYWWDGAIQDDAEVAMVAKTRSDLVDAVIETVKELHSYDVPCVIALPIETGNPDYLTWLAQVTAPSAKH